VAIRCTTQLTLKGEKLPFIGVRARVAHENLSPESFQLLKKGQSIKHTFDVAEQYDLRSGAPFTVHAHGSIPWAARGSTNLIGIAAYRSNAIAITPASTAPAHRLRKKNALNADCAADQWSVTQAAVAGCAMLAALAGHVALKGPAAQFARYFGGTSDPAARELVSRRLLAVSRECAGGAGASRSMVRCSDAGRLCHSDYISVTLGGDITNCAIFWRLPLITRACHGYDQSSLMIHETSHVDGVFEPSTVDFQGFYGWPNLTHLTPQQALTNADNYQFYANGELRPGFGSGAELT
jgi:deuterolysin